MRSFQMKSVIGRRLMSALALTAFLPGMAVAQQAAESPAMLIESPQVSTVEDLLKAVRESWEVNKAEDVARERRFAEARDQQDQLLANAQSKEAREEARSGGRGDRRIELGERKP